MSLSPVTIALVTEPNYEWDLSIHVALKLVPAKLCMSTNYANFVYALVKYLRRTN